MRRADAVEFSRRSLGVTPGQTAELVKKVVETLLPRLRTLPGFGGYHLIKAGNGVMSSIGFFDTSAQADESTKLVSSSVREERLEILPNTPRMTTGEIVVHRARELVQA